MRTRTKTAIVAGSLLALFAATTAATLSHEHEGPSSEFAPHIAVDAWEAVSAWWNGSSAQALYRRWDGHLGELCANPSHRH